MTKRQAIDLLRDKLRERNADSNYTNQFLYGSLLEHANWLIRRDISARRIYQNTYFFRPLKCVRVIETSTIDPCCPIKTNCKIYRTKNRLPEMWLDTDGPVIKSVASVDGNTQFNITSPTTWESIKNDPYQKYSDHTYTFFHDGYLWFPERNPNLISVNAFWKDDVSDLSECSDTKDCVRFLDKEFMVPTWLEAEMFAKALQQLAGVSKAIPEDNQIDKNPTRRD